MTTRATTPFTNEHFVNWLKAMWEHGSVYWYGTCVYKCTNDLYNRKKKQYPEDYGADRTSGYMLGIKNKSVAADCVGACKGYAWTNGGQGTIEAFGTDKTITNSYATHGAPDLSADGMFDYAKKKGMDWGTIGTLPEIPGLALRMAGHVGYYIGNGEAIEWKGFKYGCVKTEVKTRGWLHWYKLPFIDYDNAPIPTPTDKFQNKLVKKGMKGADVTLLQSLLVKAGYSVGSCGVDGDFGNDTYIAVKSFQIAHKLEVDGIVGPLTQAALLKYIDTQIVTGKTDEEKIWTYLMSKLNNAFGVAGMMGNIRAESNFKANDLQGSYERKLGYTDQSYTEAVDSGKITRDQFSRDSAGYGLAQWTYWSRKQSLYDYAKKAKKSIGDLYMQLDFLCEELEKNYPAVWNTCKNAKTVQEASDIMVLKYEKPASVLNESTRQSSCDKRAKFGMEIYNKFVTPITKMVLVKAGSWNIRTAANYDSTVVGYAHGGDKYTIVDYKNGWYTIAYNGTNRYISAKAIEKEI